MDYEITVQLDGEDVPCGRLYTQIRRGVETSSFAYHRSFLERKDAFALSPDLPLAEGTLHASNAPLFSAFEDCMPDRWGRNLLMRAERGMARVEHRTARALYEGDLLGGVSDLTRQGALRVWKDGVAVAEQDGGVPQEVDLPRLLDQADWAAKDMDADIRDLLRAGSSLGGARPKASCVDARGALHIAKFPKADETPVDDICAWEHVALVLAGRAGIEVPASRLIRVGGRALLLLERFDRDGAKRIPYLSGLSAVQGADGGDYSYVELAEFLESEGEAPSRDISQLWLRILFSCSIGNTDDHMRNHGLLRGRGGWRLSPAFDVNPTPGDQEKYLSCAIDLDERLAVPSAAVAACELYRVTTAHARAEARKMARVLSGWRRLARQDGIAKASIERMSTCFEAGISRLEHV